MSPLALRLHERRARKAPRHLREERIRLADGARTTVYVARYDARRTDVRVVRLPRPQPLEAWCRAEGQAEALVGGFFARPHGTPLGELRTAGVVREHVPFDAPFGAVRACLHVAGGHVAVARRDELDAAPAGDLLQAGPLLVRCGRTVPGDDEGFSAGAHQFDSDITAGRYPRAALGVKRDGTVLAVACDGRADDEAGLTMAELAETMVALGALSALNLDGGGSTSLVCAGRLRNRPRESHGVVLEGGRAVSTAVVFRAR
ncbi:phosphodiester glycosidase family protein [Conexibacter sp. SYSU D00693]|uniref:phosphodiester glycosidase family protein n=1 Tax=Conexibacter sp. SYSU D00693 TaxID=2812560 RepID=UPI00196B6094|nr:phosphodiester glycosidase family protein [Conexibacter sp. SYSU D00693]